MIPVIYDSRKANGDVSSIVIPRNVFPVFNHNDIFTSNECRNYY